MGVDLTTYRARIGTFRHSVGVDVVTIVCCVNFTGALKTIGSVLFIGLLLIIAGIEQNPGPMEDVSSDWETESTSTKETLIQFLWKHLRRIRTQIAIFMLWAIIITVCYDVSTGLMYFILLSFGIIIVKPVTVYRYFSEFVIRTYQHWTNLQLFFCRKNNKRPDKDNSCEIDFGLANEDQNTEAGENDMCQKKSSFDEQDGQLEALTTTVKENGGEKTRDTANEHHDQSRSDDEGSKDRQSLDENGILLEASFAAKVEDTGGEDYISKTTKQEGMLEEEELLTTIKENGGEKTRITANEHHDQSRSDGEENKDLQSLDENEILLEASCAAKVEDTGGEEYISKTSKQEENGGEKTRNKTNENHDQSRSDDEGSKDRQSLDENGILLEASFAAIVEDTGGEDYISKTSEQEGMLEEEELLTTIKDNTESKIDKGTTIEKQSKSEADGKQTGKTSPSLDDQDEHLKTLTTIQEAVSDVEIDQEIEFKKLLRILGLENKYPGKITLKEVITIHLYKLNDDSQTVANVKDLPWFLLQRIVSAHSEARDMAIVAHDDDELDEKDLLTECQSENKDISPLDIFHIVYLCSDHNLRQVLFQKLYLCKIAVPFLYIDFDKQSEKHTLSLWPLRFMTIETKILGVDSIKRCKGTDPLEFPTKVVAFARFGRPQYSKSKLINSLLSTDGYKTFFHVDCPSGMTPRVICNGFIEMFWLPTIGHKKETFQDAITFLNLRGDLETNFSENVISMLTNVVDSMTIIIETPSLRKRLDALVKLVTKFTFVNILFTNPTQQDKALIDSFRNDARSKNAELKLKILHTHKGSVQRNVVDMVSYISKELISQLQSVSDKSLEERLKSSNVWTDESHTDCQKGKHRAQNLFDLMKKDGKSNVWKQALTPVQCKHTKDLGDLMKKLAREKVQQETEKISLKISKARELQMTTITPSLTFFVESIVQSHKSYFGLDYFLGWLKFFIEREKRKVLPQLMDDYHLSWQKLRDIKSKKCTLTEIECQERVITKMEVKIDEASFSIDHFFRELGHIYDAFLESGVTDYNPLPPLKSVTKVIASCILNSREFELIDGESFYMPHKWIKNVFKVLKKSLSSEKVMTVSVMGLQSSGKSTLLNTMFGSQFSVRSGRCTRGIHMQLIPLKYSGDIEVNSPCNYVALIDTEGLRSPELSNLKHEHDNELATVITGLGDITLLNIMGENTSEIKDVLQVIVHAFLRLKLTNRTLDISKCCTFIYQNVTDASASENMLGGLSKLLQTLDEMTKESAACEGIVDITTFNQVIECDINSQVWYLKNLWQGNPPMARVNYEYSERTVEIKTSIILKALQRSDKSYKTIQDILIQGFDLWKGVLNEDFVFCFRNTLEMKAYIEMDSFLQKHSWNVEFSVHEKMTEIISNNFALCNHKEELRSIEKKTETDLKRYLFDEKARVLKEIESYFTTSKYKDIIIQWKQTQKIRLDNLCSKLEKAIFERIGIQLEKRSLDILTVSHNSMHEEKLLAQSIDVANKYRGKNLDQNEISKLFEDIWDSFVQNINMSSIRDQSHRSVKKMQDFFILGLYSIFSSEGHVVKIYLSQFNNLEQRPSFSHLYGSSGKSILKKKDVSFSKITTFKDLIQFTGPSKFFDLIKTRIEHLFKSFDNKILKFNQTNDELTEIHVSSLLLNLQDALAEIENGKDGCKFTQSFKVKISVYVSNFACHVFNDHNDVYQKQHGVQARLDVYREQQKISFEAHLNNRKFEDTFASLLANIVEVALRGKVLETIPNRAADFLFSKVPNLKNRIIFEMLTQLAEQDNFEDFHRYIFSPKGYTESWITERCNRSLFDTVTSGYYILANEIVTDLFRSIRKCIEKLKENNVGNKSAIHGDVIINQVIDLFKQENLIIPKESFRCLQKLGNIHDVEYLCVTIIDEIKISETKLKLEMNNTTQDTVKWKGDHPITRIFQKVWGCQEHCAFCREPCANNEEHTGSDHYSLQHRPLCCIGSRELTSGKATMESCNFLVKSNKRHNCATFSYMCNTHQRKNCELQWHEFKNYWKHLPFWNLSPSSNMYETSKYWLWFVARYEDDLKALYNYDTEKMPRSWENISKEDAVESLKYIYSA